MHRAAHYHRCRQHAQLALCRCSQLLHKHGHDVLVGHQLAMHRRFLLHQRAAQQAFERTHQAAFRTFQIALHCIAAKVGTVFLRVEEHGRGHGERRTFCLQQLRGPCRRIPLECHGRVGGTEINAQQGRRGNERHRKNDPATRCPARKNKRKCHAEWHGPAKECRPAPGKPQQDVC
ncbi:hypothetical protein D3C72_1762830 [compost metagenome]